MRLPKVHRGRRIVQWSATVLVLLIGVQFTLWVSAHLAGQPPSVPRPAGVEAFLPIGAMVALRHFLVTGTIDPIHPAGLAILVGICLMSLVMARSFCSHLCPVGLLSELLGRLGWKGMRRPLRLPRWLDIPLRSLKYLLLAFFVWAVWWSMPAGAIAAFLQGPYMRVADVKMWMFFAAPSRTTLIVLGVLLLGSLFVRDLWCRYLCPYGALLGIFGKLAPLKITRDPQGCVDCQGCTRVCPARLPIHRLERVSSFECTSCQDCVAACPVSSCLRVAAPARREPRFRLRPVTAIVLASAVYLVVVAGFRISGHWQTELEDPEYQRRIQEISSPIYDHVGRDR